MEVSEKPWEWAFEYTTKEQMANAKFTLVSLVEEEIAFWFRGRWSGSTVWDGLRVEPN